MKPSLVLWVIYEKPLDFPEHYVVRKWHLLQGHVVPELHQKTYVDLESAQKDLPDGLYNLGRKFEIDPKIVEVWV